MATRIRSAIVSAAFPTALLAMIAACVMSDTVAGFIVRGMFTTVIPHWLGF